VRNVCGHSWIGVVLQIFRRYVGRIWIAPPVLQPQSDTNRAGERFLVAGWHLQDLHFSINRSGPFRNTRL
jgi:hypothetical protein